MSFEDAQRTVVEIINGQDIVVGHGLENDLKALKIVHLKVVDTAIVFKHPQNLKFSLKTLAKKLLNKDI